MNSVKSVQFNTDQLLVIEQLKTKILKQIIFQKLGINIDDTIDDLVQNEKQTSSKPIEKCTEEPIIKRESVRKTIEKKKFKAIPNSSEEVVNEPPSEYKKSDLTLEKFGEYNYSDIKNEIEALFQELITSKSYGNIIANIKIKRNFHLAEMNLKEYTNQLKNDIDRLKTILAQKEYESKRIDIIVAKILTPLDYRLLFYNGVEKLHIEPEQISKLHITLRNCANYSQVLTPFSDTHFITYFQSYNSIFFDIKMMLETYIDNPYKLKNIIFIDSPSSDPLGFAYYLLDRIESKPDGSVIKYWVLDRRLETLTRDLSVNLKQYLIQMFRKIYKLCYGHNKFKETVKTKYPILEIDGIVLLNNLFLTLDESKLNKMLRETFKTKLVHSSTTHDRFDKINDDKVQHKEFEGKIQDVDKIGLVMSLFDEIDEKRALQFYNEI